MKLGIASHSYAYIVVFAICGPKYNTKVCNPVPNPTEDIIPNTNQ